MKNERLPRAAESRKSRVTWTAGESSFNSSNKRHPTYSVSLSCLPHDDLLIGPATLSPSACLIKAEAILKNLDDIMKTLKASFATSCYPQPCNNMLALQSCLVSATTELIVVMKLVAGVIFE